MTQHLNTHRALRHGLFSVVLALTLAEQAAAISILNVGTFARWGSGNTIFDEDGVSGAFADPGSTPLASSTTSDLDIRAIANTDIAAGKLGLASAWEVTSPVAENALNRFTGAGANIVYVDTLTVSSGALAANTPVQLQFSFALSAAATVSHVAPANNNLNDPHARALVGFQSLTDGTVFFDSNDNKIARSTHDGSNIVNGLMLAPNQTSFFINTFVGDTLTFSLSPSLSTGGVVGNNASFSTQNFAFANLGIAFGAAATGADAGQVTLLSELLGGNPFPDLASATAQNAAAALPDQVTPIPLPPALFMLGSALAVLLRSRRCPRLT